MVQQIKPKTIYRHSEEWKPKPFEERLIRISFYVKGKYQQEFQEIVTKLAAKYR